MFLHLPFHLLHSGTEWHLKSTSLFFKKGSGCRSIYKITIEHKISWNDRWEILGGKFWHIRTFHTFWFSPWSLNGSIFTRNRFFLDENISANLTQWRKKIHKDQLPNCKDCNPWWKSNAKIVWYFCISSELFHHFPRRINPFFKNLFSISKLNFFLFQLLSTLHSTYSREPTVCIPFVAVQ